LNDLFYACTGGCLLIDLTRMAIAGSTGITQVMICPATTFVVAESGALVTLFRRTFDDLPAGDKGLHVADARDADLLFGDCMPDALQPLDIGSGIAALATGGLGGEYQSFIFIQP
jgi:hypothetical protein